MNTCPNCRYELRAGMTACPMCGTGLPHPVKRRSPAPVIAVLVLVVLAVAATAYFTRGPSAEPASTTSAGCRQAAPRLRADTPPRAVEVRPLDGARRHTWVLETSCGRIDVLLDVERAPQTAASVAALAREGFYNGTAFHRVVEGFVVQGGDPTATGQGGPGYTIVEPPPAALAYEPGVVAMAKTQTDPPGTSGSQFFIVSGAGAAELPAEYAVVGRVSSGMDVVRAIERAWAERTVAVVVRSRVVSR